MIARIMLIAIFLITPAAAPLAPKAPVAPRPQSGADPSFRDFVGTNGVPTAEMAQQMGIGWVRADLAWPNIEHQKGQFQWAAADNEIKQVEGMGLQFLATLDYSPAWAATDPKNPKSPPKNPQDWTNFVEQVVARYSAAPYNVRYFQVWNEPTPRAGFFTGTPEQFIDQIYLPAAQIIRRHHCFVVFGGWPSSNPLPQYEQTLNYHDAWRWTDIVDVHYLAVSAWAHLCTDWVKTGKCRGVWQTEIGATPDVSYLPRYYLEGLYGALGAPWTDPDQYKFFWFTFNLGGSDSAICLVKPSGGGGLALTSHGVRLKVLNDVLGGGALSLLPGVSTRPSLPPSFTTVNSTALGFKVGESRAVVALILVKDQSTRAISVQVPLPHQPSSVELVDSIGGRRTLQGQYAGGRLTVNVPRDALHLEGVCLIGYLQMDGI